MIGKEKTINEYAINAMIDAALSLFWSKRNGNRHLNSQKIIPGGLVDTDTEM